MSRTALVIGAGVGGLAAALRLARRSFRVTLLEARATAGGLASGVTHGDLQYDAGPYILLDRPGLEWAFRALDIEPERVLTLAKLDPVYEVTTGSGATLRFCPDLEATAAGFDRLWPGAGKRYQDFVHQVGAVYQRLFPLQHRPPAGFFGLLRSGAWRHVPFLLRSLGAVLERARLPAPLADAVAIWTHVAGQDAWQAPSPMAFVAALVHSTGAYYPLGGMKTIPQALTAAALEAGVELRRATKVKAIRCEAGRACGVETEDGEFLPADAVVSNHSGVGSYLDLVAATPPAARAWLGQLPLQSPGVCAYLAVRGEPQRPYLRFHLRERGDACRVLVLPEVVDGSVRRDGWAPARLIAPMDYEMAQRLGPEGQRAFLAQLLDEPWWRAYTGEARVVATRIPAQWGAEFHLYRDSMNPVMTARFMRQGRLAHRSPYVRGLYLAGSSTHPGQWVSFCTISGVLAADCACEDFR